MDSNIKKALYAIISNTHLLNQPYPMRHMTVKGFKYKKDSVCDYKQHTFIKPTLSYASYHSEGNQI